MWRALAALLLLGCVAETETPDCEIIVSDNHRTWDPNGNPSDVDWGRYEYHSRAGDSTGKTHGPLGDPTRWGARVVQTPDPTSIAVQGLISNQIIRAQCADTYPRPWSLIGTIEADKQLWDSPEDGSGGITWTSSLDVFMGVGQNTLIHRINVRAVVDADAPFYFDSDRLDASSPPTPFRTRAFIVPGGLIGNALSITVRNFVLLGAPVVSLTPIVTQLQITPFNAGTGL